MTPNIESAAPETAAPAAKPLQPGRVRGVKDADILAEARKRYERASSAASENRTRYREALRFVGGEQWDERLKAARESSMRPCLVMDRLGTHINQVVNDQRQSKPAIKVHPDGDKSNVETAKIFDGVIRNIEHLSNAPAVYETASWTQVAGGQGAWRVLTQYIDEQAFEQDILLKRILDPTTVTFDDQAKEQDASDGKFAFIEDSMPMEDFKEEYPEAGVASWAPADAQGWWGQDSVRRAEYYRVVNKKTTIYLLQDGSVMDEEALAQANAGAPMQPLVPVDSRTGVKREVQWFKLGGNAVLDSRVWPGKWIPLVRVVGNEMMIDGKIIYTGLTHRAMDPQRMYNYQTSVVVELLSLQKSAPYIGAKGQFKGVEAKWRNANIANPAYLEYEPVELNGSMAPAPQRQSPPTVPTGNVQAIELAANDLQWVTGQHAANFGAQSNETSGRAIMARQREGDGATYHYLDNLSRSILHTGRILVDLIPKIYDTKRVLRVIGEDETSDLAMQDPQQQESMVRVQDASGKVQKIYNLGVGRYDVAVAVGPSFGTKRQESVEAMSTLLQGNPELWQAIGDLFLRNQDWPGAQEMADRLKKMLPPNLADIEEGGEAGPEAQIAQMEQALQQASQMMDERDQALQQASEQLQALQTELQSLQADQLRKDTDVESRTLEASITADKDVRVAEIQQTTEIVKAQQSRLEADNQQLMTVIEALKGAIERLSEPEQEEENDGEEKIEPEAVILEQLVQGQTQLASMMGEMAEAMRAPRQITVAKTEGGFQAMSVATGG